MAYRKNESVESMLKRMANPYKHLVVEYDTDGYRYFVPSKVPDKNPSRSRKEFLLQQIADPKQYPFIMIDKRELKDPDIKKALEARRGKKKV